MNELESEDDFVYASSDEITAARNRHCTSSEEIEIDEPAKVSQSDDGYWVQAWLWVPNS